MKFIIYAGGSANAVSGPRDSDIVATTRISFCLLILLILLLFITPTISVVNAQFEDGSSVDDRLTEIENLLEQACEKLNNVTEEIRDINTAIDNIHEHYVDVETFSEGITSIYNSLVAMDNKLDDLVTQEIFDIEIKHLKERITDWKLITLGIGGLIATFIGLITYFNRK